MHKILKNYFDLVLTRYPFHRVLAVLVRGSQNYNQSTTVSDLDVVAVILPPLADLARGLGGISTTLHTDTGDILVQSFDLYCKNLSKANPVFLETMTTPYYVAVPHFHAALREAAPLVQNGNPYRTVMAATNLAEQYLQKYCETQNKKYNDRARYFAALASHLLEGNPYKEAAAQAAAQPLETLSFGVLRDFFRLGKNLSSEPLPTVETGLHNLALAALPY